MPKFIDEPSLSKETGIDRMTLKRRLAAAGVKPARTTPSKNGVRRFYNRARALAALRDTATVTADQDATRRVDASIIDIKMRLDRGQLISTERMEQELEAAMRTYDTIVNQRPKQATPEVDEILRDCPRGSADRRPRLHNIFATIVHDAGHELRKLRERYLEAASQPDLPPYTVPQILDRTAPGSRMTGRGAFAAAKRRRTEETLRRLIDTSHPVTDVIEFIDLWFTAHAEGLPGFVDAADALDHNPNMAVTLHTLLEMARNFRQAAQDRLKRIYGVRDGYEDVSGVTNRRRRRRG